MHMIGTCSIGSIAMQLQTSSVDGTIGVKGVGERRYCCLMVAFHELCEEHL